MAMKMSMIELRKKIYYSDKYRDDTYEYRHCHLPKELLERVPKDRVMTEHEWRHIGIQQSEGWVNYMVHQPEPHIILFRRPIAIADAQAQKLAAAAAAAATAASTTATRAC